MSLDPSLLLGVSLCGGLIQDYLQQSLDNVSQGFWAEWLAWLIIIGAQAAPILYRKVQGRASNDELELASLTEKVKAGSVNDEVVLGLIAFSLIGATYLQQSEYGKYYWALPIVSMLVLGFLLGTVPGICSSILPSELFKSIGSVKRALVLVLVVSWTSCIFSAILASHLMPKSFSFGFSDLAFLGLSTSLYCALTFFLDEEVDGPSALFSGERRQFVSRVSSRAFAGWTLFLLVLRPGPKAIGFSLLIRGVARALDYLILYTLASLYSSCTMISATTIPTIAMSIGNALRASSPGTSLGGALVALVALLHATYTLPSTGRYRKLLFIILIFPVLTSIHRQSTVSSWETQIAQKITKTTVHPIENLVAIGQERFTHLLASQSDTVTKATKEYKKRYHRHPPPQFDEWFKLAVANEYVLLDEFDTIMETLEPFWSVSPAQLRHRVEATFDEGQIIKFKLADHALTSEYDSSGWVAAQIESWLPPEMRLLLPNMTIALNALDEPRVVAPFEVIGQAMQRKAGGGASGSSSYKQPQSKFLKVESDKAWKEMSVACALDSPARIQRPEGEGHSFVSNLTESLDVCKSSNLHNLHGLFLSPQTMDLTHTLVPVFSQAKPSIFNDVLIPSPYYAAKMDQHSYKEEEDIDWTSKGDAVYWSGSSTGGHATAQNWHQMHRQRLILELTRQPERLATLMNETTPGKWTTYTAPRSELASLFRVKITGSGQCEPEACAEEEKAFALKPTQAGQTDPNQDAPEVAYQAKYVLDLDGNGFSGRFYRLLKSKSAVVKQTIFKEWHDGLLIPWVHFIPLSMEGDELWEMMRFFNRDPKGRALGERIAKESRSWANITLRKIDLQLAFTRLLMEYGRLVNDNRDYMKYIP